MHVKRSLRISTYRGARHALFAAAVIASAMLVTAGASYAKPHGSRNISKHRQSRHVGSSSSGAEPLYEQMRLHMTKVKGKFISASGSSRGSVAGPVSFNLTLSSASHATIAFRGSNSHGVITGTGAAIYHTAGVVSHFSGTVQSVRGSGKYAHARSLGIHFYGTMNRKTYQVTVVMRGRWHA